MRRSDKVLTERHLGLKIPDETAIPDYSASLHVDRETLPPAFDVLQGDKGVRYQNVRASYVHWYFADTLNQVATWFSADRSL